MLVRRNIKWILAFAVVFVYASGVLANASGLSHWYSAKVTNEILSFANNDFVVSQTDMAEMAEEVHGRLAALKDVRYVVSMVCLKMHLFVSGAWGGTLVYHANGTGITLCFGGISFASFIGLDKLLTETELSIITPQKTGTAILSQEIAQVLNIKLGGDFKVNTPFGNVTFQVSAVTDLDELAIWNKIDNPESPWISVELPRVNRPPELFPVPSLVLPTGIIVHNQLVLVSLEDAVDLCTMFRGANLPLNPEIEILHYVFTERENIVDQFNIDISVANLKLVKDRIESLVLDVPAEVDSLALQCFEAIALGVNLFSVVTSGYMLAALPLYWFIASALVNIFTERKRREIALFRIKGMSTRKITFTYTLMILISAVVGCTLSALLQANAINILTKRYAGFAYGRTGITIFGTAVPDTTSFLTLLAPSLILAFLAVWKMIKSITSLQPVEAIGRLPQEDARSKRLGKLPIMLLVLGLVKVGLVLGGLNPTIYFKYSPPNPYVAMAVGLFAAFDLYALTALAPVFIAYGLAKVISTHSEKFSGLIKTLSYLAGLGRRKISFRLISSEMWRASAVLLLVALLISYGVASYICNTSLTKHVWKMAGEFTGSDMRIDCLPNATQNVEQTLKGLHEVLDYARIDVVTAMLIYYRAPSRSSHHVSFMVIDPEQYNKTAYLDNSPQLRSILTGLKDGYMIGLEGGLGLKYMSERLPGDWYFPNANATVDTELYSNFSAWQEITVQHWADLPIPGTIEDYETIRISYSLNTLTSLESVPDEPVYPELLLSKLYLGQFRFSDFSGLSQRMANYSQKGSLWKVGEFVATSETVSDIRHLHYKTHFIIKLKGQISANSLASALRSQFAENVLIITREEATSIITRSVPKITAGLAFTQINSILITAISFGGLAAVTITNVAGRRNIFSLLRVRGAKKTDGVALFIPEVAFVSLIAGGLGIFLGLTLAMGFTASLTDFVPPLFTGGILQMVLGWITWLFVSLILVTFASMYVIATFSKSKLSKSTS